jgi:hypothetical protein
MQNVALIIMSGFFYLFIIGITTWLVYKAVQIFIDKKRIKKAYRLLVDGYKIVTCDSKGIPLFMEKDGNYERI